MVSSVPSNRAGPDLFYRKRAASTSSTPSFSHTNPSSTTSSRSRSKRRSTRSNGADDRMRRTSYSARTVRSAPFNGLTAFLNFSQIRRSSSGRCLKSPSGSCLSQTCTTGNNGAFQCLRKPPSCDYRAWPNKTTSSRPYRARFTPTPMHITSTPSR